MKKELVSLILLVCRYKVYFFMLYIKVVLGGYLFVMEIYIYDI